MAAGLPHLHSSHDAFHLILPTLAVHRIHNPGELGRVGARPDGRQPIVEPSYGIPCARVISHVWDRRRGTCEVRVDPALRQPRTGRPRWPHHERRLTTYVRVPRHPMRSGWASGPLNNPRGRYEHSDYTISTGGTRAGTRATSQVDAGQGWQMAAQVVPSRAVPSRFRHRALPLNGLVDEKTLLAADG